MSLFSGLSRPLKAAGLSLVGVAIIAAGIGGVTALNAGGASDTAAPPTRTPPSTPSTPDGGVPGPASSGAPSTSPSASQPPPASPSATSAPGPAPTPGSDQAPAKWVVLRVYNNSTIHGLAARAGDDLRRAGWNVVEVSNYPSGVIPDTTAFYRPGTDEETAAKALAAEFGMRAEPRFDGIQQASPGVIVIVTNNYQGVNGKPGS
jgi:hypothetical protein